MERSEHKSTSELIPPFKGTAGLIRAIDLRSVSQALIKETRKK